MNPYFYNKDGIPFSLIKEQTNRAGQHYSVKFRSAYETPFPGMNLAEGEYYLPVLPGKSPTADITAWYRSPGGFPLQSAGPKNAKTRLCLFCFIPVVSRKTFERRNETTIPISYRR